MSEPITGFTPGPWDYVASTEHHGPYVDGPWGGTVCDCYTMSNLADWSVRNGGTSKPIHHQKEQADANAKLIASAPTMYSEISMLRTALEPFAKFYDALSDDDEFSEGVLIGESNIFRTIEKEDLRRARAALTSTPLEKTE